MEQGLMESVAKGLLRSDIPDFGTGDTVRVYVRVIEGEKERTQTYEGIVIQRRGSGIRETFTVRKIATGGVGVERIFPVHSPRLARIELVRSGRVRRSRVFYLRKLRGRAARIAEKRLPTTSER